MDHPVAGHATPPLQAQMDPYRDPPRLVFKSSESQLEEIKKLNTEKLAKCVLYVITGKKGAPKDIAKTLRHLREGKLETHRDIVDNVYWLTDIVDNPPPNKRSRVWRSLNVDAT